MKKNGTEKSNKKLSAKSLVAAAFATCMILNNGSSTQAAPTRTLGTGSGYTLSTTAGTTNKEITHYDSSYEVRYYDPNTGAEVAAGTAGAIAVGNTLTISQGTWYANYTKTGTRTENPSSVTTGHFMGITNGTSGGYVGAALYNANGTLTSITSDFVGNSTSADEDYTYGGAFANGRGSENTAYIGTVKGDFIENMTAFSSPTSVSTTGGGAIAQRYGATINSLTGNFYQNAAKTTIGYAYGGAIYNSASTINTLDARFYGNSSRATITAAQTSAMISHGGALYNSGTIGTINNGLFVANYSRADNQGSSAKQAYGGAIYNSGVINSLDADFHSNYVTNSPSTTTQTTGSNGRACGGAIYNSGTLTNLQGSFTNNYAASRNTANGGAIFNTGGTISNGSLNGATFHSNWVKAYGSGVAQGGAIVNTASGKIYDLNTDFVMNAATSSSGTARGGAIYNCDGASIGNIVGSFIYNSATGTNAIGGTINNSSTIGNITGDFLGNSAVNNTFTSSSLYGGGAIFNEAKGTLGNLQGTYSNNKATNGFGGAILNLGTIGNIVNSTFKNNYATATGQTYGGAIYTSKDLTITADNGASEFTGNYTTSNGTTDNNAIYVSDAASTLTLSAKNSGTVLFNDNIKGASGYGLSLTGDSTGTITLNDTVGTANATLTNATLQMASNTFSNATLDTQSGTVDLQDGTITNYNVGTLTSDAATKYTIDVDLNAQSADKIITGNASSGTVTLDNIQYTTSTDEDIVTIQILETQNSNLQLALGSAYSQVTDLKATLADTVYNNVEYKQLEGIRLSTTDTTNDSITHYNEVVHDALQLINTKESANERKFVFQTTDKYTVTQNLGTTTGGTLTIDGLDGTQSEIDFNGKTGFELANETTLNINDAIIGGSNNLLSVTNENAVVNLQNVTVNGNLNSTNSSDMARYSLNISGADTTTTLNGRVDLANTTLTDANLVINTDTFSNANLDAVSGSIDMVDGQFKTYEFEKLTSADTKYSIDISSTGADNLIMGEYSTGTVHIDSLNFTSTPTSAFLVQVLQAQNDNIQLTLNSEISKAIYNIGRDSKTEYDTVLAQTSSDDIYQQHVYGGDIQGSIKLATKTTTNDSIELSADRTVWDENPTSSESMGDTLALWNQLDTTEDKTFTLDGDYTATSDLGQSKGNLTIAGNGKEISLGENTGFELSTILNVNNATISGNKDLVNVLDKAATVNLSGATLNGNINTAQNIDSYTLNISGSGLTTINGTVDNAVATLNDATLAFNTNTFANATLNAKSGNINLQDNQTNNYEFEQLNSNADTSYKVDVNISGSTPQSDKFVVGSGSTGTITIDGVNFINSAVPTEEFVVQLIDAKDNSIQLAINSSISGEKYDLGTVTDTVYDTVTSAVKWNDLFYSHIKEGIVKGTIDLATTNTTNDSLALKVTETIWGASTQDKVMGDTLALVNKLGTTEDKNFNFESKSDVYKVTENLGVTTAGKISINGVEASTIDANKHSLFDLQNQTELNISNTIIKSAEGENGSVINIENSDAVANLTSTKLQYNTSTGNGGAINNNGTTNITNSNFVGNSANKGGAIYTTGDLNLTAKDNFNSIFIGNTSKDAGKNEAIFVGEGGKVELNATTGGAFTFFDEINGNSEYIVTIKGDKTGKVLFNNKLTNANIEHNNVTTSINGVASLNGGNNSLTMNSGIFNVGSLGSDTLKFNNLTLNGGQVNVANVNVDLVNQAMGRVTADSYGLSAGGTITVSGMTLLNETNNKITAIQFADEAIKDNVTTTVNKLYTPISIYEVSYDASNKYGEGGYFLFNRGGSSSNPSAGFNPSVLTSPVASQIGGYASQTAVFDYAFNHSDTFMPLPANQRFAIKNANRYAITDSKLFTRGLTDLHDKGTWYRPYTSFESIGLADGPKVDAIIYGTLVGGDTELKDIGHGWSTVTSAYVGYNGANIHFSNTSTYQNGGLLGLSQTFYKNNFFTAVTATAGASVGESNTMFGHEHFTMLSAGVASKSGYNLEFNEGKLIVQPNLLMSYSFINTFDYTNAAGVNINSDPLHAIQIKPAVRVIGNMKNGWQPYFSVGMVWNLMDETKVTANQVRLPQMSIKPYVEYGVGVQKRWKDKCTGFLQAMIRNGGRNGVSLSAGFRWAIGRDPKVEKVEHPTKVKKVLKEAKTKKTSLNSDKTNN